MALVFSELTDGVSTTDPSTTASITPTADAHVFLVSFVVIASGTVDDSITVSGNGLTWTQIATVNTSRRRMWVHRGTGASPTTGSITIDYTGTGTFQEAMWSADQVTGADATTPNDTPVTAVAASGTSLSLPDVGTPDTDDFVYGAIHHTTNEAVTAESGYTVLTNRTGGANVRTLLAEYDGTAPLDETPSASWATSDENSGIGFIINVAAAAGGWGHLLDVTRDRLIYVPR